MDIKQVDSSQHNSNMKGKVCVNAFSKEIEVVTEATLTKYYGLLDKFSHASMILKFYGYYDKGMILCKHLCKSTNEMWSEYEKEMLNVFVRKDYDSKRPFTLGDSYYLLDHERYSFMSLTIYLWDDASKTIFDNFKEVIIDSDKLHIDKVEEIKKQQLVSNTYFPMASYSYGALTTGYNINGNSERNKRNKKKNRKNNQYRETSRNHDGNRSHSGQHVGRKQHYINRNNSLANHYPGSNYKEKNFQPNYHRNNNHNRNNRHKPHYKRY